MSRAIKVIAPLGAALAYHKYQGKPYLNDSSKRRAFYEDDDEVTPVPGSIIPASSSELKSLGPNTIVNGVTVRSPSFLESSIKNARLTSYEWYTSLLAQYDGLAAKYYNTEREVTSTISSLHDRKEDLLPNGIYVLIGALTGSIASRNRNILVRGFTPVVFGLATFNYFLPQTFERARKFAWNVEQKNLPQLSEQQQLAFSKAESLTKDIEKGYLSVKEKANGTFSSTTKAISDYTALNTDRDVTKKN